MPNCEECQQRKCIETGKPCKLVERWLKTFGIKSADWIRPENPKGIRDIKGRWKETPFSALGEKDREKNPYFRDKNP